jgi:hypothetical protein
MIILINNSHNYNDINKMKQDKFMQEAVQKAVKNTCLKMVEHARVNPFLDVSNPQSNQQKAANKNSAKDIVCVVKLFGLTMI